MNILQIQIQFPRRVKLSSKQQQRLASIISEVCKENTEPGMVFWPSEFGQKMLSNPFMVDDEHPMEFDEDTFFIGCCEREK